MRTEAIHCNACDDLRGKLAVGQTAECACGKVWANYARHTVRPNPERHAAHALDTLYRDGALLAAWFACSSVRAIDLDPAARYAKEEAPVETVARLESRVEVGRQLERVLRRLTPDVRAIVQWVADRGCEARPKHDKHGRLQYHIHLPEAYAVDCGGRQRWADWRAKGGERGLARDWGSAELERAAIVWVAAKQGGV